MEHINAGLGRIGVGASPRASHRKSLKAVAPRGIVKSGFDSGSTVILEIRVGWRRSGSENKHD
jgi:hypothetical protein